MIYKSESTLATLILFEQDILLQQQGQGVVDGTRQFLKDSLDIITNMQSYIEFAGDVVRLAGEGIKPLPFRDTEKEQELLLEVINPEEIAAGLDELWEIVANIDEIVEGLSEYEKSYYETYIYLQGGIGFPFLVKKNRNGGKIMESSGTLKQVDKYNRSFKLWNPTKKLDSVENAYNHWIKHKTDFPNISNSTQYVEYAKNFMKSPPVGTLTKKRLNGDTIFYNKSSNIFAVQTKDNIPRTIFKPKVSKHGYTSNLAYYNAQ